MGMAAGITLYHMNRYLVSYNLKICITDQKPFIGTVIMKMSFGMAGRKRAGNSILPGIICIGTIDFIIIILFYHTKTLAQNEKKSYHKYVVELF